MWFLSYLVAYFFNKSASKSQITSSYLKDIPSFSSDNIEIKSNYSLNQYKLFSPDDFI